MKSKGTAARIMNEDKKLKCYLVLQSFFPLFILLFIRHFSVSAFRLLGRFFSMLFQGVTVLIERDFSVFCLGDSIISIFCMLWFIITSIVALGFRDLQKGNYDSRGETITVVQERKDSGATFLVTFILPILIDDVSTLRNMGVFSVLLIMVVFLLMKSDLFYQNPVLMFLKYKTFEFRFNNPDKDVVDEKIYIGITKGSIPSEERAIKRKYIADDVFLIFNE